MHPVSSLKIVSYTSASSLPYNTFQHSKSTPQPYQSRYGTNLPNCLHWNIYTSQRWPVTSKWVWWQVLCPLFIPPLQLPGLSHHRGFQDGTSHSSFCSQPNWQTFMCDGGAIQDPAFVLSGAAQHNYWRSCHLPTTCQPIQQPRSLSFVSCQLLSNFSCQPAVTLCQPAPTSSNVALWVSHTPSPSSPCLHIHITLLLLLGAVNYLEVRWVKWAGKWVAGQKCHQQCRYTAALTNMMPLFIHLSRSTNIVWHSDIVC